MRIASPYDWTEVRRATLDVVLSDIAADEALDRLECVLWRASTYFEEGAAPVLARAQVRAVAGGLALARFEHLRPWGACVLAVLRDGATPPLVGSGVILGGAPLPRRLSADAPAPVEDLRFPLPVVDCELSQIKGEAREPVEVVAGLDALIAPPAFPSAAVRIAPLIAPEEIDAGPALERAANFSPATARHEKLLIPRYVADAPFLADIRDAHVILPSGVVMPEGRRIWSDSTLGAFWLDPWLTRSPGLFPVGDQIGRLPVTPLGWDDLLADNGVGAPSDGVPLLAYGQASANYMHWMFNSVFAVWLVRDAVRDRRVQVIVPDLSPLTVSSMAALGVGRESLLAPRAGYYRFDRLLYPSPLSTYSNRVPPRAIVEMYRTIGRALHAQDAADAPDLIYVTRDGAPSMRRMTNEPALVDALLERGFEVIAPHELAFADEVRAFSRARLIVGQLGAGLCNIGFSPPGCRLVELATHNYGANDYWYQCAIFGHRLWRVTIHADDNDDEFCSTPFSFTVPLEETLRIVDEALARL